MNTFRLSRLPAAIAALVVSLGLHTGAYAQQAEQLEAILQRVPSAPPGIPAKPLPTQPWTYATGEGFTIEVQAIGRGLSHPWGFAQLPDGTLLVTERNKGQLRIIRNGQLDPTPVAGVPAIKSSQFAGLHDVVLHPDFAKNKLIYLTYNKPTPDGKAVMAVLQATWDGKALTKGKDIFLAEAGVGGASRLLFDGQGHFYLSIYGSGADAQDLKQQRGKVLRLNEDGKVPADNPFARSDVARPEIYTLGHRTIQGLLQHPVTGAIWSLEMGPNGGDELNIIKPGANYGWPIVSLGRDYSGPWQAKDFRKDGIETPIVYWMPSISVSGMTLYTGDKIPKWKGDLLVGGLRMGEIPGTGQVQRIRFNANGDEIRREALLTDLHVRIRGVHQGSDGYLYALVDEDEAAVLRIGVAP